MPGWSCTFRASAVIPEDQHPTKNRIITKSKYITGENAANTKNIGMAINVPIVPGATGESPEPNPNDKI